MGHYDIEEKQQLRVHYNIPHDVSVALSSEDLVDAFPVACPAEGTNCEDIVVTNSPGGVCDGTYYGESTKDDNILQGPDLFSNECSSPEACENGLQSVERKIWMFLGPKCETELTEDCPDEAVWAVSSTITNATGHTESGYLRAWANGAGHPVDVASQWWMLELPYLDPENVSTTVDCENPDCLIPVAGITIECHPDSPNRTLPPGWTPYPSSTPAELGTLAPFPTPSPAARETIEQVGDLNGAFRSSPLSVAWCTWLFVMTLLKLW